MKNILKNNHNYTLKHDIKLLRWLWRDGVLMHKKMFFEKIKNKVSSSWNEVETWNSYFFVVEICFNSRVHIPSLWITKHYGVLRAIDIKTFFIYL